LTLSGRGRCRQRPVADRHVRRVAVARQLNRHRHHSLGPRASRGAAATNGPPAMQAGWAPAREKAPRSRRSASNAWSAGRRVCAFTQKMC